MLLCYTLPSTQDHSFSRNVPPFIYYVYNPILITESKELETVGLIILENLSITRDGGLTKHLIHRLTEDSFCCLTSTASEYIRMQSRGDKVLFGGRLKEH